uniref:Otoraplin n=1 Tax=Lates calcarifer TaxID=8187 RepID=A0A4W6DFQ1_LATCA
MSYPLVILLCVGLLHQTARAAIMDKLADNKICGDAECSHVLSMATALDDFIAPDCRFINIKKGQMVYVYSKLIPEEGAGVFWSGSVCAFLLHMLFSSVQLQSVTKRQQRMCSSWDKQMRTFWPFLACLN